MSVSDTRAPGHAPDPRRALDTAHHLHPFTDHRTLHGEGGTRIIESADGIYLRDSEGRRILDGMAGLWCVNVGYGRGELADAAAEQMRRLPYYNAFFKTATPPSIDLAARLAALTPAGLNRVFFGSSGSESIDTMIRLVRHYWNLKGEPRRKTFISRRYAYHGSTVAAASLGGMTPMHRQADLPLPGFVHVMPPYWCDYGGDEDPEVFGRRAADAIEERILELGPDSIAAFVGEPIQGAGGVIVPPDSYWPRVQEICRHYGILLVADEVICGFGRTGHWFGSDLYAIEPDLMTLAKGITSGYLPLSALMVGDRVAETLIEEGGEFFHGYTYSGHPTACAVALANLDIIEREGLVERVHRDTGPYLQARLRETFADHPIVGEVRGAGFLAAIELVADRRTRARFENYGAVGTRCRDHAFRNDLVMRAVRDAMVMSPPLIATRDEIDELVDKAKVAIDATARDLGRV
ncbi:MAG: aspartate aminotransferase family protein [Azospirillaceae bacterium]